MAINCNYSFYLEVEPHILGSLSLPAPGRSDGDGYLDTAGNTSADRRSPDKMRKETGGGRFLRRGIRQRNTGKVGPNKRHSFHGDKKFCLSHIQTQ